MQDAVTSVLHGELNPQEALDVAQATAQRALDRAWMEFENDPSLAGGPPGPRLLQVEEGRPSTP